MTNSIYESVKKQDAEKYATYNGRATHAKLQFVRIAPSSEGDAELIEKIMASGPELQTFFGEKSKSEVPVAGIIDGHFVSRRIDRLVVDDVKKTVYILDYKTDIDTEKFRPKYIAQLREYKSLMSQIYPGYKTLCYILWLHNWRLERL